MLSVYAVEVLARLDETIVAIEEAYGGYHFNEVAQALYDFFWGDYCDWFVEAAKTDIFAEDPARKAAVLAVMDHVLSAVLRLLHPLMPHITEELWALLGFGEGSIQFATPPNASVGRASAEGRGAGGGALRFGAGRAKSAGGIAGAFEQEGAVPPAHGRGMGGGGSADDRAFAERGGIEGGAEL